MLDEKPAIYLGKVVSKSHFRVFVYSQSHNEKLVESWVDYEKAINSGEWFETKDEAIRTLRKNKSKDKQLDENKTTKETKDTKDDFLPIEV